MWISAVVSAMFHLVACFLMLVVQFWESESGKLQGRNTLIPGTNQQFLYWQDFYCQLYGDLIGLPLITWPFFYLVMTDKVSAHQWISLCMLTLIGAIFFVNMCLSKTHKPDSGYHEVGKISWVGIIHALYLGLNAGGILIMVWSIINGNLHGPIMWAANTGSIFYLITFIMDTRAGHFAPLKRLPTLK
ncbi:MAG: hypothetical protein WC610_02125 [Patescibacteria group bacterium]